VSVELVLGLIIWLGALFGSVILHEVAHGWVAYRLGDPTAKLAGRLTLNPLAHIDLTGTILLPLLLILLRAPFIIGWAKPVPINPLYFRRPYQGMMLVGAAGPLTNLALAGAATALWYPLHQLPAMPGLILEGLGALILINIILAAFNLIPIPPLDGSRVLAYFLPPRGRMMLHRLEPFGFLGVLAVLLLLQWGDVLERLILPLLRWLEIAD